MLSHKPVSAPARVGLRPSQMASRDPTWGHVGVQVAPQKTKMQPCWGQIGEFLKLKLQFLGIIYALSIPKSLDTDFAMIVEPVQGGLKVIPDYK